MQLDEAINLMQTVYANKPQVPTFSQSHPYTLEQLLAQGIPLDAAAEIMSAPNQEEADHRFSNFNRRL
jgi:hypothetical protein